MQRKRTASIVALCAMLVVSITAVAPGAAGSATSPHESTNWAGDGDRPMQNYTMYLYDDSSHAPGAQDVSIWYEIIVHSLPEDDRRAWLNQSITVSPWVSACEIGNLEGFFIDRGPETDNGTGGGKENYQTYESQINTVDTNYDATWRGEEGIERYNYYLDLATSADEKQKEFPLSSNGFDARFLETSATKFWTYEQASSESAADGPQSGSKQTFEYENRDRVIVDYANCYTNPSEPGWYRQTSLSETYWKDERQDAGADQSKTEGAPSGENYSPVTYSHWVYICDCQSYDEAVDELGAPPEMNGTKVANPEEFAQYYEEGSSGTPTPTPSGSEGTPTPTPSDDATPTPTPSDDATPTPTPSDDATPTPTDTATATATDTPTDTPDDSGGETTEPSTPGGGDDSGGDGPGFGVVAAIIGLLAAALLARRAN